MDLDNTTGLQRRESFLRLLNEQLNHAQQEHEPLGLLALDVDELQHFNYIYGYMAGDAALGAVATILRALFRSQDLLCRFESDTFCILLAGKTLQGVLEAAEQVRQAAIVVDIDDAHPNAPRQCLSYSIGIALYPRDGESALSLVDSAEHGIAYAKRHGGNRVCHFSSMQKP